MMESKPRLLAALAASTVFLVALCGCTRSQPDRPEKRDALQPIAASYFPSAGPSLPARILGEDAVLGHQSLPWRILSISGDRSALDVVYVAGDLRCVKPVGFAEWRWRDRIYLSALSETGCEPSTGGVIRRATVPLSVPLGGTTQLWHAAVSAEWNTPELRR